MPKPKPLSTAEAQHLVDYVLERLSADVSNSGGLDLLGLTIALQRLLGAIAGEAAELRLQAVLHLPCEYLFGDSARAIAQARAMAAADVAALQVPA